MSTQTWKNLLSCSAVTTPGRPTPSHSEKPTSQDSEPSVGERLQQGRSGEPHLAWPRSPGRDVPRHPAVEAGPRPQPRHPVLQPGQRRHQARRGRVRAVRGGAEVAWVFSVFNDTWAVLRSPAGSSRQARRLEQVASSHLASSTDTRLLLPGCEARQSSLAGSLGYGVTWASIVLNMMRYE